LRAFCFWLRRERDSKTILPTPLILLFQPFPLQVCNQICDIFVTFIDASISNLIPYVPLVSERRRRPVLLPDSD